jgi:hypothetical protein
LLPFWSDIQSLAGHDAARILRGKDLTEAANKCPDLKAFLNTILKLSGSGQL